MYKQITGNVYIIVVPWEQEGQTRHHRVRILMETSLLYWYVETPTNTVPRIYRHRVRAHPQQPLCPLLGERDNTASLTIPR